MLQNPSFPKKNDSWAPLRAPYRSFFSDSEIETLVNSAESFESRERKVVVLAFENRYAFLGGLASVTKYLPLSLARSGEHVIFISPFHKNNEAIRNACKSGEIKKIFSNCTCSLGNFRCVVTCYKQCDTEVPTYFIAIKGFFEAKHDPYAYKDKTKLLDDALAFSCSVPFVLNEFKITGHILLHANDWETAPVALSSKIAICNGVLRSAKTVLTLHNSYDSGLTKGKLHLFFGKKSYGKTILEVSIPLLDAPLTTVSEPFAFELTHDPLQKGVFVDHLQTCFSMNPPLGIENGVFDSERNDVFSRTLGSTAGKESLKSLYTKKETLRKKLVQTLSRVEDKRIIGELSFDKKKKAVPIFLMSGRFDIMQKGFDVIFHAFNRLEKGRAKLIFSPSNPSFDVGSGYSFFKNCAHDRADDITIWPFLISETVYQQFLKGSTYLIMPSFYEPFGAATEGFINGTPVIARGTGGLWVQVDSSDACFVPPYYDMSFVLDKAVSTHPTGILYRESYSEENYEDEWRKIFSLPPQKRLESKLYRLMVEAAHHALESAIEIFHKKNTYSRFILNGLHSLNRFSWKYSVKKYKRVYDSAERRIE